MKLYLGNRSYSSWSLRVWLLMDALAMPFEEELIGFDDLQETSPFKQRTRALSPAGKVPIVQDGAITVWDSLAIVEYLAERYPDKPVWPTSHAQRALARSACAHLHSSYLSVRGLLPMNIGVDLTTVGQALAGHAALQRELHELFALWQALVQHSEGPFLFGQFGAVDAFFAPYLFRFSSYGIALPAALWPYRDALMAFPSLRNWAERAAQEYTFVPAEEPYRTITGGTIQLHLAALDGTDR